MQMLPRDASTKGYVLHRTSAKTLILVLPPWLLLLWTKKTSSILTPQSLRLWGSGACFLNLLG